MINMGSEVFDYRIFIYLRINFLNLLRKNFKNYEFIRRKQNELWHHLIEEEK